MQLSHIVTFIKIDKLLYRYVALFWKLRLIAYTYIVFGRINQSFLQPIFRFTRITDKKTLRDTSLIRPIIESTTFKFGDSCKQKEKKR